MDSTSLLMSHRVGNGVGLRFEVGRVVQQEGLRGTEKAAMFSAALISAYAKNNAHLKDFNDCLL